MTIIKNIIFDLGGVIINIDTQNVIRKLEKKGVDDFKSLYQFLMGNGLYKKLETGAISAQDFRNAIHRQLSFPVTDQEIDEAWNAIILDIPEHRVRLLEKIRKKYRTFLLSNTNIIHFDYYNQYFRNTYNYNSLDDLFDKTYFSHKIGMRKPDPAIFKFVLKNSHLVPRETLFIDDNNENIKCAESIGIKGYYLEEGKEMTDLFDGSSLAIGTPLEKFPGQDYIE
ncbi:MAG: HAD family phosphatase [Bacteroidetes bacterium]|nr:HAD family phosphatase [Bacteroidota bacterium]